MRSTDNPTQPVQEALIGRCSVLYSQSLLAGCQVDIMNEKTQKKSNKAQKQKFKKPSVVDDAYRILAVGLIERRWQPGEKLPKEHALEGMLGISRGSVREALKRLRKTGAIETLDGQGSWVSKDFEPHMLRGDPDYVIRLSREEFHDMIEFRQNVELKCVELAAMRATEEDITAIERALNAMMANRHDYKMYSLAESEFHLAVMRAAHNTIFTKAINAISGEYQAYLEELNEPGIPTESVMAHGRLYEALKQHDAAATSKAMAEIMKYARQAGEVVEKNRESHGEDNSTV